MSIETIVSILGFGLSVAAFMPLFFLKDRRREVALISLATVICVVTAWHVYDRLKYDNEIQYVRSTLLPELSIGEKTYEDMQQKLGDINVSLISDAINKMLRGNEIVSNVVELKNSSGEKYDVRLYKVE